LNAVAARRGFFTLCVLFFFPILTLAQSSLHPQETQNAEPVASSSLIAAAALDLPDAPTPSDGQNQAQTSQQTTQPKKQQTQPTAPNSGSGLSLQGLGFSPQQTQANAALQAKLNKRTHDLKVHQTLGLITLAPMIATIAVSGGATQKHSKTGGTTVTEPSSAGVDLHAALGSLTAALYGATAYYAIVAPKIPGVKPKGAIRLHRDLVWIHGPGMILTPILGGMALSQEDKGEKIHGIASAHQYVAITTVGAYAAAIVAVSWPIHLKFWEK